MQRSWRLAAKRTIDCAIAGASLLIFAPAIAVIAVAVRFSLGSPILFQQDRIGRDARRFRLLKFRTMSSEVGKDGTPLPDAERLTPLGRFLRSSSLDELPQLINVLKGEMSLVGPRPLLPQYLQRYTPEQARRHEVLPGITGWAQVNGRNAISWERKFELDTWYVDNWSIGLDLYILLKTALRVVQRRDVASAGHATMPEFMGSDDPHS